MPLLYRRIALVALGVLALMIGSAGPVLGQNPKPDPAPAAVQHKSDTSSGSSSGSTHGTSSPPAAPPRAVTPAPVVSPSPAPASIPTRSTPSPAKSSAPKHKALRAKAKAKTAKKIHHAKPTAKKAKPVVRPAKPAAPRPPVHTAPARTTVLPVEVPPAGSSGSSLSNRSVLLLTFMATIVAAVLALLARGLWRRVWWWRQYHKYSGGHRARHDDAALQARATLVPPWPADGTTNGSNRAVHDDEPETIVSRAGADASTGT